MFANITERLGRFIAVANNRKTIGVSGGRGPRTCVFMCLRETTRHGHWQEATIYVTSRDSAPYESYNVRILVRNGFNIFLYGKIVQNADMYR